MRIWRVKHVKLRYSSFNEKDKTRDHEKKKKRQKKVLTVL